MKNQEVLKEIEKTAAVERTAEIGGKQVVVKVFPAVKENPAFYRQRAAIVDKLKRRGF